MQIRYKYIKKPLNRFLNRNALKTCQYNQYQEIELIVYKFILYKV